MKTIVIGIMPRDKIRQRVLAIARGDYKPKSGEPKPVTANGGYAAMLSS